MSRRPTLSELAWPMDDESRQQAQEWVNGVSAQVLEWTWRGFDRLHRSSLATVDINQPLEGLERDLARLHYIEINKLWAQETCGESAITPHHEYPENESRSPAPAKPPAYDIAFIWENARVVWPIEAKVVPSPSVLADYVGDVQKFVSGIAAPLSGEGAQIAYLLTGKPNDFFDNLSGKHHYTLTQSPEFKERPHRVTLHTRTQAPNLRLHHLAMFCGADKTQLVTK